MSCQYTLMLFFGALAVCCFAGDIYLSRRRYNRFSRKNEKYFNKHGNRITGRI